MILVRNIRLSLSAGENAACEAACRELKLSAATEEMAEKMCDNWEKASKEIYEFAMKKLL